MRAIVWIEYGPPEGLQFQELAKPVPKENQLLIRVRATTVSAGDCELRGLKFSFGLRIFFRILMGLTNPRHKVLGQEFAGEVETVGKEITQFKKGDQVFGTTGLRFGTYAEYILLPERGGGGAVAIKPRNVSFEEAAAVPLGGLEALHFLRRAGSLAGRSVAVNGAGGGIGTIAVQLATHFGAHVTAVDSAGKLDVLRGLGADRVLDYRRVDFTKTAAPYDVIFDVVGRATFSDCLAALRNDGCYLLGNPRLSTMLHALWSSRKGGKRVIFGAAHHTTSDLNLLRELIEAGRIRPVIDQNFPLDGIPEAHRYVETGLVRGKVVITV